MSRQMTNTVTVGQRFGKWTALSSRERGDLRVPCRCDCGTEKSVAAPSLARGKSVSCGCHRAAVTAARFTTHGRHGSGTYGSWTAMNARCTNPRHQDWKYYGGRGVTICTRWSDFGAFLEDMGERPAGLTLDRKDPNGNYEPGNCRWATSTEQSRNRRPRS